MRVECPVCGTSYTVERLGLALGEQGVQATVLCVVCRESFEVAATYNPPVSETRLPQSWTDWVLRRSVGVIPARPASHDIRIFQKHRG